MLDILGLIDSKEIRECNRNRIFTPIEQAVLIYASEKKTVENKLSAWKELMEVYSVEKFQQGKVGRLTGTNTCFRSILQEAIEQQERALSYRTAVEGAVFCASLSEAGYLDHENMIFSTYEKAYAFLREEKREYLEHEALKDVQTYAVIALHWLDQKKERGYISYHFDNGLRLIEIRIEDPALWGRENLESFYVHVSLPFRKGDILRTIRPSEDGVVVYGVLTHEPEDEKIRTLCEAHGDMVDMSLTLETIQKKEGKERFSHEHWCNLLLEKCPDGELPKEQEVLKLLRAVYQEKISFGHFLELYSRNDTDFVQLRAD